MLRLLRWAEARASHEAWLHRSGPGCPLRVTWSPALIISLVTPKRRIMLFRGQFCNPFFLVAVFVIH